MMRLDVLPAALETVRHRGSDEAATPSVPGSHSGKVRRQVMAGSSFIPIQ